MKTKLSVIGQGIIAIRDLTVGGLEKIRNADYVIIIGSCKDLDKLIRRESSAEILDITQEYYDGAKDVENYDRFYQNILCTLKNYKHVVFIVPGHPRIGVTVVQWLEENKSEHDFDLEVDSAISSFDTMLNDLAVDPLERGSAIVDANRFILFEHTIEPSINYFIYHVCSVGTSRTNFIDPSTDNRIDVLQEKLMSQFPSNHRIALCESSDGINKPKRTEWFELNELTSKTRKINFSTSLFVPCLPPKKVDIEFLKLLKGE